MTLFYSIILSVLIIMGVSTAKEQSGIVTFQINLEASKSMAAEAWVPYPVSGSHQVISDVAIIGNFSKSAVYHEPQSGALYLHTQWQAERPTKELTFSFAVKARENKVQILKETTAAIPSEVSQYLTLSDWVPTDGEIAQIASEIKKKEEGLLGRARLVYDWVVEHTTRDPNVVGCGIGDVEKTLSKKSGKCADLSSVYVALARNVGVPAREVFGLRLGKKSHQDITGWYHCWAEFYLPGTGWVPVDPSDVRKLMLKEKKTLKEVAKEREYYFGSVDAYRIALQYGGRGITFEPKQKSGPLNYFMYPYVEVGGKAPDYYRPETVKYSVSFKAL